MQPTLKTLADAAGLSISTISLALRKDGRVRPKTRELVERLARQHNYRPNTAGAILAGYRAGRADRNATIAMVTHTASGEKESVLSYFEHLKSVARMRGYEMEHYPVQQKSDARPLIKRLFYRGISGVILSHTRAPDLNLFDYSWQDFSTVALLRTRHRCPFDLVTSDVFYAVRECWQRVRAQGYRRIGALLCRHHPLMEDDLYREGAFAVCQNELTRTEKAIPPFLGDHGDDKGILAWVRKHRPDVVIGFNLGHYWLLRKTAKMPEQFGFVALHTETGAGNVSGCYRDEDLEITMAVDHVDLLIRHRHRGQPTAAKEILIRPIWQEGATLRSAGSSS